jgi:hypothetical protein
MREKHNALIQALQLNSHFMWQRKSYARFLVLAMDKARDNYSFSPNSSLSSDSVCSSTSLRA